MQAQSHGMPRTGFINYAISRALVTRLRIASVTSSVILRWQSVVLNGESHSLEHLNASIRELVIAPNARAPERRVRLAVTYGLHCFSVSIDDVKSTNVVVSDGREQRTFDLVRYRLSLALPDIVSSLELRRCFHTGHRNFFTVELVDEQGQKQDYVIYFRTWRAATGEAGDVRLHVESAYLRSDAPQRHKKSIRFKVIVANTYTGKEIQEPKN